MTTFASDDFTDSDATLLQSHTPTGGGSWTKVVGGSGLDIEIYGNGAAPASGTTSNSTYYHSTAPAGAEYDVTATIKRVGNSATTVGLAARQSSSAQTHYLIWPNLSWTLYKAVAGAYTSLGTYGTAAAVNDVVKLECKNATKKLFINGVERISSANNDITAAGYPGLHSYGSSTLPHIDTWLAEEVGGTSYTLNLESGSYTISGSDATFLHNYLHNLGPGTYTVSGADATLLKNSLLNLESGSYTINGSDLSFELARVMDLNPGSYAISGSDVTFVRSYQLNMAAGAYNISGQDITFTYSGTSNSVTIKAGSWLRYRTIQ